MAALAAAVAGAVFGRMSGFFPESWDEEWLKWGWLDFRECPECYFGLVSFPPLLAICVVLRFTLFKEFAAPRKQRAVIFPMMMGPTLAIGAAVALLVTGMGLGIPDLLSNGKGGSVFFVVEAAFVQGVVVGAVGGAWFEASQRPAASRGRARSLLLAALGVSCVFFGLSPTLVSSLKKGDDRRRCIGTIRRVQMSMRSEQGVNGHNSGDVVPGFGASTFVGSGLRFETFSVCPAGGQYTWVEGRIPDYGESMIRCSCPGHIPQGISEDW